MLNVKAALEDRFPDFFEKHTKIGPILLKFLGFLFHEARIQQFEREDPYARGLEFVEKVLLFFDFSLRTRDRERARIPSEGAVVIVANHPIGSLDGLALLNLVASIRPDVKVLANDLLLAIEPLRPVLLPVNNMDGKTPKPNLETIKAHLESDGAAIIFPAGEVSRFGPQGVRDGVWHPGFLKIARSAKAPILPIYVAARNSVFFYSLSFLAKPLSTVWLVREMFKQCHRTVDARIGHLIPIEHYDRDESRKVTAQKFKRHVYGLARNSKPLFQGEETVAPAENRLLLSHEIADCELLGSTPRGREIRLYKARAGDCILRELGRLRELSFRAIGEGSGCPRDIDRYDYHYDHLLLWHPIDKQIVGAYRLADVRTVLRNHGLDGLYTSSLFDLHKLPSKSLERSLELGRSFVQYRYRDRHSLDELWSGLGAYISQRPTLRYLFGPVSMSRDLGERSLKTVRDFYHFYFPALWPEVIATTPFVSTNDRSLTARQAYTGDYAQDFKVLRQELKAAGQSLPPLYKYYTEVAKEGGVGFSDFNIDPNFKGCIDGFIVVNLKLLKQSRKKRYLHKAESK